LGDPKRLKEYIEYIFGKEKRIKIFKNHIRIHGHLGKYKYNLRNLTPYFKEQKICITIDKSEGNGTYRIFLDPDISKNIGIDYLGLTHQESLTIAQINYLLNDDKSIGNHSIKNQIAKIESNLKSGLLGIIQPREDIDILNRERLSDYIERKLNRASLLYFISSINIEESINRVELARIGTMLQFSDEIFRNEDYDYEIIQSTVDESIIALSDFIDQVLLDSSIYKLNHRFDGLKIIAGSYRTYNGLKSRYPVRTNRNNLARTIIKIIMDMRSDNLNPTLCISNPVNFYDLYRIHVPEVEGNFISIHSINNMKTDELYVIDPEQFFIIKNSIDIRVTENLIRNTSDYVIWFSFGLRVTNPRGIRKIIIKE